MAQEQGGAPGPGLSPCPLPASAPDLLQHLSDSRHVAVYHKGRFFKLWLYEGSQLLKPCDLELQFQRILDDPSPPQPGEEKLAALTAGGRYQRPMGTRAHPQGTQNLGPEAWQGACPLAGRPLSMVGPSVAGALVAMAASSHV